MQKKLLSILLTLAMVITMMPAMALTAFASQEYPVVYVSGKEITEANRNDVFNDGGSVTFTPTDGSANAKLTLNSAELTKINYIGDETLDIEVSGNCTITPSSDGKFGIITWRGNTDNPDNPNASLRIFGDGKLTVNLTSADASERKNGIFVNKDLTIEGVTLKVNIGDTVTNNHGIHAENDITIDGAKVSSTVGSSVENTTKPICAYNDVIIKGGAEVTANAGQSISEGSYAIFATKDVKISGSNTKVNATSTEGLNSSGIFAEKAVEISGGAVTATAGDASAESGFSVGILASKEVKIFDGIITAKAGIGDFVSAIAAIEDDETLGTLTVGSLDNIANITGAQEITEGKGVISDGCIEQSGADPVVIAFQHLNSWSALQKAINDAGDNTPTTITLTQDVTACSSDSYLLIPQDKNITIDLNGHKIDRNLTEATSNGNAIVVEGDLIIDDTSSGKSGMITGGYASNYGGGGLCIKDTAKVTLTAGSISENNSVHAGGGVFLTHNGIFIMEGGKISNNHTDSAGGGVYAHGNFTFTDGEISNNTSTKSGAGVYVAGDASGQVPRSKHFTMTGGKIFNNVASDKGGGVYIDNYDMDALLLGGEISGNSAEVLGGGVCANAAFTVGNDVKIINNTVSGEANNVFLRNISKPEFMPQIILSGDASLKAGAKIGVTLESGLGLIINTDKDVSNYFIVDGFEESPEYKDDKLSIKKCKVYTEDELLYAIASAEADSTIVLGKNIDTTNYIHIPEGKEITLDLNGFALDRKLSTVEAERTGHVIIVYGKLKVKDNSSEKTGKITGGNTKELCGSGVLVEESGTFTLESGSICGNKSQEAGAGVFVATKASFIMNGGKIEDNQTDSVGAGVFCHGKFEIHGGEIAHNKSQSHGAGIYVAGDSSSNPQPITKHFIMTDGKIYCNETSADGGGIYLDNNNMDAILLGGEISGNSAKNNGGGVCCNAPVTVGGTIKVDNNSVNGEKNNIYLYTESKKVYNPVINISSDSLKAGAKIGVSVETPKTSIAKVKITSQGATQTDKDYFFADSSQYTLQYNEAGYLELKRNITGWKTLQEIINAASDNAETLIELTSDIIATDTDESLVIPASKNITINLNGYKIDRGLGSKDASDNGNVITVCGKLTINDNSTSEQGQITGGNSKNFRGGGIYVWGGNLVLNSGNIVGNKSEHAGAGVLVMENANFVMNGGKIIDNHTNDAGGGVFCHGNFEFNDGDIAENTAVKHGAGVYVHGVYGNTTVTRHFVMNGGKIYGNVASVDGGGVYIDNYDMDASLYGGEISGNSAAGMGGGVCANTGFVVGNNVKIVNNTVKNKANNVCLCNDSKKAYNPVIIISADARLTSGAKIGVTTEKTEAGVPTKIVSGDATSADAKYFAVDNDTYTIQYNINGYLELVYKQGNNPGGGETTDEPETTPGEPTTVDVTKEVKVEKTETGSVEASVDITSKVTDIVKNATDVQSKEVIIDAVATTTENVSKVDVTIPAKMFEDLSKIASVENIIVQTNVAELTFDKETAKEIATQSPSGAVITVEAVREDEESTKLSQDVYELKVIAKTTTGQQIISDFKGGKVTVKVDIPAGLTGKTVACLYRNDRGVYRRRSVTKQDDVNGWFSFTTKHFSDYIVAEESAAEKLLVDQTKVTQNKLKAYKGKKIRVSIKRATWDKELGKKITGYQIYRSTKKSKGFKKVATLTKKTSSTIKYFNKKGLKSGKKYYYKVRGKVKLSNGKYAYTKFSAVKSVKCK